MPHIRAATPPERSSSSWVLGAIGRHFPAVAVLVLLAGGNTRAGLVFAERGTVAITSDRTGQPIFQNAHLAPGHAASGSVTLGNAGTLPFEYALVVRDAAGPLREETSRGLQLEVRRAADDAVLYRGPLAGTGRLGALASGEEVRLDLQVGFASEAGSVLLDQPLTVDFVWVATQLPTA